MIQKLINSNSIFYQNITVLFFVEFFLVSLTLAFGFFIHAPLLLNFILCATIWALLLYGTQDTIKKSYRFIQLRKYFSIKSHLPIFLEKFQKSVYKDTFTDWINPIEIDQIRENMENISSLMKLISWPLIEFRKIWVELPDEAKNVLERFILIENTWLNEYIEEFWKTLSLWIEIHTSEISEYQKQLLLSKNQKIFSLSSARLSSHIEDLEKVRV